MRILEEPSLSTGPTSVDERWAPLVSVVIPTYNRRELLSRALASVCNQTYRPIEVIVVDDGSTDGTEAFLLGDAIAMGRHFDVGMRWVRQKNLGAPTARNRGFAESRGELIQFLDSDDLIDPDKLAVQVDHLRKCREIDISVCQVRFLYPEKVDACVPSNYNASRDPGDSLDFVFRHDIAIHSTLIRRELVERTGGFKTDLWSGQEVDFHMRLAIGGARFGLLDDVLVTQVMHKSSRISNRVSKKLPAKYFEQFNATILQYGATVGVDESRLRGLISSRCRRLAEKWIGHLRWEHARICYLEAAKYEPERQGGRGQSHGVPTDFALATLLLATFVKRVASRARGLFRHWVPAKLWVL